MRRATLFGLMALVACSDALEQDTTAGQVIAVAEENPSTLSLVPAANLAVSQSIPLPAGVTGPVSGFGSVLIVAIAGGVAVIDLTHSTTSVTGVVPLAPGGASRGTAIQDEAIAWVASVAPSAVWRVNYRTGDTASVGFAASPRALAIAQGNVFVVTVGTAGASWLTVIDTAFTTGSAGIAIVDSIPLTGLNAGGITLGGDGYLYVVSSPGRLSIVDPVLRLELAVVNGLGDSLGPPVYHASGRILIASANGILEVNPATRSVTVGPSKGIKPAGDDPSVLVVDQRGRVYALAHCAGPSTGPGAVHVLSPPPDYTLRTTIGVGSCPVGAATATMP